MSDGWQVLIRSLVKQRRLKKSVDYVKISSDVGKSLIGNVKDIVIEADTGYFHPPYFAYFFKLNGQSYYFETGSKICLDEHVDIVNVPVIEVPR